VGVGFVGVTGSDMDLEDQEKPTYETATAIVSGQVDIAINVSPEKGFLFWPLLAANFVVFDQVSSPCSRPDCF
jgi:hypothetical protein